MRDKYEIEFCGELEYNTDGFWYELKWYINTDEFPRIMVGDFESEDKFFDYICKEIDRTKYFRTNYFVARRVAKEELCTDCKDDGSIR